MKNCREVYLSCDDHAEVIQFIKYDWNDNTVDYEFNILDSYCGEGTRGFFNRVKRAWKAFWAKPVCYTGIFMSDEDKIKKFLKDCLAIVEDNK